MLPQEPQSLAIISNKAIDLVHHWLEDYFGSPVFGELVPEQERDSPDALREALESLFIMWVVASDEERPLLCVQILALMQMPSQCCRSITYDIAEWFCRKTKTRMRTPFLPPIWNGMWNVVWMVVRGMLD